MRKLIISTLLAGAAFAAQPAHAAATLASCGPGDISPTQSPFTQFASFGCVGFLDKNVINDNPTDVATQIAALGSLGLTFAPGAFVFADFEKLSPLGGSQTINFTTPLNGITYVGMHFGNGEGGPGNASAIYRFDAGTDLDKFYLLYQASSNAILYKTGTPAVPEPTTWAMMLVGFGTVGFAMRRRRNVTVSFA